MKTEKWPKAADSPLTYSRSAGLFSVDTWLPEKNEEMQTANEDYHCERADNKSRMCHFDHEVKRQEKVR